MGSRRKQYFSGNAIRAGNGMICAFSMKKIKRFPFNSPNSYNVSGCISKKDMLPKTTGLPLPGSDREKSADTAACPAYAKDTVPENN